LDLPVTRAAEVTSCVSALSTTAAVSDYNGVKTAINEYLKDASELLKEELSETQLKRLIRNTASGLVSNLKIDPRIIKRIQKFGFVDENFESGQFVYKPDRFNSGLAVTTPPEFTRSWNKMRQFACIIATSANMDNTIDSFINCEKESVSFEASCPRLDLAVRNIFSDALRPIEFNIQQQIDTSARELLQVQVDSVVDRTFETVESIFMVIIQAITMYIIMMIVNKLRNSEKKELRRKLNMLE
jgi:hypothetical protein